MEEIDKNSIVYHRDVVELVTVAVRYCAYLEEPVADYPRTEFVDTLLKLLPLLYLKGMLLPDIDSDESVDLSDVVTEENYNIVRNNVACVMGEHDDYLDVFVDDMKYSDTPILMTVSENLADIYQDLKNFVVLYKDGTEETMTEAIAQCRQNFKYYWGQRVANVMRALHDVRFVALDGEDAEADTFQ